MQEGKPFGLEGQSSEMGGDPGSGPTKSSCTYGDAVKVMPLAMEDPPEFMMPPAVTQAAATVSAWLDRWQGSLLDSHVKPIRALLSAIAEAQNITLAQPQYPGAAAPALRDTQQRSCWRCEGLGSINPAPFNRLEECPDCRGTGKVAQSEGKL